MDKTIAGLLGAVAALGTVSSSQAMPVAVPVHVLRANSYADLLKPIDKASEFLAHSMSSAPRADEGRVELTRYRHHHHHHHHYRRRTHHRDQQDEYVRIR